LRQTLYAQETPMFRFLTRILGARSPM